MFKKVISTRQFVQALVFSAVFFLFPFAGKSGAPGGGMSGASCWPPPCSVPLDGGISVLIAAGVALAGKKFYDNRKKV